MKLVCKLTLVFFSCVILAGCNIAYEQAMLRGMEASKATTDADIATLVLENTTTPEVFVEIAKAVSLKAGYAVNSVGGGGQMRVVMATKQIMDHSIQFIGSKRDSMFSSLTLQLNPDGRSIQINVSIRSNLAGQDNASKIANDLKGQMQQLYAQRNSK